MKKIGVLTFQSSDNYGALLQAFGTCETIKAMGYFPEIINYHSPEKKNKYKLLNLNRRASLKTNIISLFNFPFKLKRRIQGNHFRYKILGMDKKKLESYVELESKGLSLDKVIVGSDQVWNYKNTKFDRRYFLDFIAEPDKKISYAASFAVGEIEENYKNDYAKLLEQFSYLSIRELQGVNIVKELTRKDSQVTLDPSLLLSKEEWESHLKERKKIDRYLVIYSVINNEHTLKVAKKIAEEKKLKIVIIAVTVVDYLKGAKAITPSPMEFVNCINNADYVVTSSFHGLAFAVNLNIDFTCCLSRDDDSNARQLSLLEVVGLLNRVCFNDNIEEWEAINWKSVNCRLLAQRELSINFLRNALAIPACVKN